MGCEHPEWLPVGWKVRVKIRSCGKKDKYYVDPSNGLKFNSKREVFRYLEGFKKDNNPHNPENVNTSRICGTHRKYGGPTVILHFNGIDARKNAVATNNVNAKAGNRLEQRKDDDVIKLSDKLQPANRKKQSTNETNVAEHRNKENDSVPGNLPDKLVQVNEKEQDRGGRRQIKLEDNVTHDQSLQSGSEGAEEKNITAPDANGLKLRERENNHTDWQDGNVGVQNKKMNSKRKWVSNLPRRTSKRLARVEINPSLEVKLIKETGAHTSGSLAKADDNTSKDINNPNEHHRTEKLINNNQTKPGTHVGAESKDDNEKHPDSAFKDLLMDPCIEFAIKTLTGVIPFEEMTKVNDNSPTSSLASASSSMVPSVNIWADPCFEFAVKTLTSDMATDSGGSELQIAFQQPLSSAGPLPNFRLDNIYSSNYSFSQSDVVQKPYMRQQGITGQRRDSS